MSEDRPRNPRGRPPLAPGQPTRRIHVRLSDQDYRDANARSSRDRATMAMTMRKALRRLLDDEDDD